METYAFKMKLNSGMRDEYKQRHNKIWPELTQALRKVGVVDYSIHFDAETNILFAVMRRQKTHSLDELSGTDLMQKWWAYMADIMEMQPNNQPISIPLENMFEL